jgi:hypothetical protein
LFCVYVLMGIEEVVGWFGWNGLLSTRLMVNLRLFDFYALYICLFAKCFVQFFFGRWLRWLSTWDEPRLRLEGRGFEPRSGSYFFVLFWWKLQ